MAMGDGRKKSAYLVQSGMVSQKSPYRNPVTGFVFNF